MSIRPVVDLSKSLGPARSQGQRSTCMAFAMSDLNRAESSAPSELSAEFLYQAAGSISPGWKAGEGLRSVDAIAVTKMPGQPLDDHFPYQLNDPVIVGMPACPEGQHLYCSSINLHQPTMQMILDGLSGNQIVGLVVRVTAGLFAPIAGVVVHQVSVIPDAYHALLAVGWGMDVEGKRYLLIRNSWGVGWGVDGHAWLPEDFVDLHVLEAFGR